MVWCTYPNILFYGVFSVQEQPQVAIILEVEAEVDALCTNSQHSYSDQE